MRTEREFVDTYIKTARDQTKALTQVAAIGLLVISKWDRADAVHNNNASAADTIPYGNCTDRESLAFIKDADTLIRDYVSGIAIPERTATDWWKEVLQGVFAAFCYSCLLIILAWFVRLGGHDLIDILNDFITPSVPHK